MLDRAGSGNTREFFRFSTTTPLRWDQLDTLDMGDFGTFSDGTTYDRMMVSLDNDIYVFARDSYATVFEIFRFSTGMQRWDQLNSDGTEVLGSPPSARAHFGMTVVGSNLYVFGGGKGGMVEGLSADLFRFSTSAREWQELDESEGVLGSPPSARHSPGMVSVGTDLYIFGGITDYSSDSGRSTELFRFSTEVVLEWQKLSTSGTPPADGGSQMAAVGNDLFVFGSSGLFRISTTVLQWQQINTLGTPPAYGQMAAVVNDLFVFGGSGLFRISTTVQQWHQLDEDQVSGSPPSDRFAQNAFSMSIVGSDLFFFGQEPEIDLFPMALFRFSTTMQKWEKLEIPSSTHSRFSHRMVTVGSNLYVFGGISTSVSGGYSADLLSYLTPQVITYPDSEFSVAWLTRVYDNDIIQLTGDIDWPSGLTVELCSSVSMPCFLTIASDQSASTSIRLHTDGRIVCEAASGCKGVTMRHVAVACTSEASSEGPLQISGAGGLATDDSDLVYPAPVATIEGVVFSDCASVADGGSIRAYNEATVKISGTTFQRSSSQVSFMSCHS